MITAKQAAQDAAEVNRKKRDEFDMDIVNRMLDHSEKEIVKAKNNGYTACYIQGGDFYTDLFSEMNGNQKKFAEIMESHGYEVSMYNQNILGANGFSVSFSEPAKEENADVNPYDLTPIDDRNLGNQFARDAEINEPIEPVNPKDCADASEEFNQAALTIDWSKYKTASENIDFNNLKWGVDMINNTNDENKMKIEMVIAIGIYGKSLIAIEDKEGKIAVLNSIESSGFEDWYEWSVSKKPVEPGVYLFSGHLPISEDGVDFHVDKIKKLRIQKAIDD